MKRKGTFDVYLGNLAVAAAARLPVRLIHRPVDIAEDMEEHSLVLEEYCNSGIVELAAARCFCCGDAVFSGSGRHVDVYRHPVIFSFEMLEGGKKEKLDFKAFCVYSSAWR